MLTNLNVCINLLEYLIYLLYVLIEYLLQIENFSLARFYLNYSLADYQTIWSSNIVSSWIICLSIEVARDILMKLTCSLGKSIDKQFSLGWLALQFSHDGLAITVCAPFICDFTSNCTCFVRSTICALVEFMLFNS